MDGTNFSRRVYQRLHFSVDIPKLAREIARRLVPEHLLVKVFYCSAPHPYPNSGAGKFQEQYFEALRRAHVVDLILGRNVMREAGPPAQYEEKQTDVNVAIRLVAGALLDRFDTAVLISGDSDMVPAAKMAREAGKRVLWGRCADESSFGDLHKVCSGDLLLQDKFLRTCEYLIVKR